MLETSVVTNYEDSEEEDIDEVENIEDEETIIARVSHDVNIYEFIYQFILYPFFNKYDIKPDVSWCLWSQQNNADKWLDAESSRKSTEDAREPRVW